MPDPAGGVLALAVGACVLPNRAWSRGGCPSAARTQGTRSPTAAHVQPDPPAGGQPSGERHPRRPAPGTSWGALLARSTVHASRRQGRRVMDLCRSLVSRCRPQPRHRSFIRCSAPWEASSLAGDGASALSEVRSALVEVSQVEARREAAYGRRGPRRLALRCCGWRQALMDQVPAVTRATPTPESDHRQSPAASRNPWLAPGA